MKKYFAAVFLMLVLTACQQAPCMPWACTRRCEPQFHVKQYDPPRAHFEHVSVHCNDGAFFLYGTADRCALHDGFAYGEASGHPADLNGWCICNDDAIYSVVNPQC